MELLYSKSYSGFVLGSLMNNTNLLTSSQYPLTKEDFEPFLAHKIIFVCIGILTDKGVTEIDPKDIAEVLRKYPRYEESLKDEMSNGNYLDYLQTLKDIDNQNAYDYYYSEVRKRTLLRRFRDNGVDISSIYDETKLQADQDAKIEKMSIKEIIDTITKPFAHINSEFIVRPNEEQYLAGTDFAQTKERMKKSPLVGASFMSEYKNEIFNGGYGFIVMVAKSGQGKTVMNVADVITMTALELYDVEKGKFVKNPCRVGDCIFINTEMDIRDELDLMFTACIANVERRHIKRGQYEDGEEERVDYAGKILVNSGIHVIDMPEFTTKDLQERIKEYCKMYDIKNVFFDYIQNNGFVAKEIASETNVPQREDMVLLQLTDRLKQIQRKEDVGLFSSIQTNGKEDELPIPTESCLAGGKSQLRKLDGCMVILPPKKIEAVAIEEWYNQELHKRRHVMKPNMVGHLLKGRGSAYSPHIKVYFYIDYGTCRYYDCFATDQNNKPIDIQGLKIYNDNEEN